MKKNNNLETLFGILSQTHPTFAETDDEWTGNGLNATPFKSLVSVALSAMTHTKRVIKACNALYSRISTPQELLELDDEELAAMIKPVAHYNRKTVQLKKMCRELLERHNGEVPSSRDELAALTGIGRKSTDIMMNFVFSEPTIAVDTHVHRVLNRVGVVSTTSREQTAEIINRITPRKYKLHGHEWLIIHGMEICKAQSPKCGECPVSGICEYHTLLSRKSS